MGGRDIFVMALQNLKTPFLVRGSKDTCDSTLIL